MMITTMYKIWKGLDLVQMLRDIDYWFWFLMLCCIVASSAIVQTSPSAAEIAREVLPRQVAVHTLAPSDKPVSDAYLTLKGVALGSKYKEKGVEQEDLARMVGRLLEQGKINKLYHDSILAGYDKGLSAK